MTVLIAATLPTALPVPRSTPAPGGAAAGTPEPDVPIQAGGIQPAGAAAIARIAPPAGPGPGTLNLAAELLALSTTTIATTGTLTQPGTGGDFWGMLAAVLPGGEGA